MDASTLDIISQFISNVGFPIVAFGAMWYMCNTTIKEIQSSLDNLSETINKLINKIEDSNE